jgi:hypothetical protein
LKVSADFSTYPHQAGIMTGAMMQKLIGLAMATFAFSTLTGVPATARAGGGRENDLDQGRSRTQIDVAALLTAARGAPPMICSLASRAVR